MRAFIFLALLAPIMALEVDFHHEGVLSQLQEKQARIMEKEIKAFLECIRKILQNGDAESGLPVLDPLNLENLSLNLNELNLQGIEGTVQVKNFLLNGVSQWDLSKLKISVTIVPIGSKLEVVVGWPAIDVSGSYDADLSLFGHTISGAGIIDGALNSLRIELKGQAILGRISIKSAKVKISLANARLVIENLTLNGNDVSGPISDLVAGAPAFLKEYEDEINKLINDTVIPIINQIIEAILHPSANKINYEIPIIGKCLPGNRAKLFA